MAGIQGGFVLPCEERLHECVLCPRLVAWRCEVAQVKRKAYKDQRYWARPVPSFGDPNAERLIVGLAPGAHGSNRTGRMFTGDRSGEWLFRALWKAGAANQPTYANSDDGLRLSGVLITAIVRCAPPGNKPAPDEVATCRGYFRAVLESRRWRAFLCLGSMAWNELWRLQGSGPRPAFAHGAAAPLDDGGIAIASYHPSQQNTFTGKLTEAMLDDVMARFLRA